MNKMLPPSDQAITLLQMTTTEFKAFIEQLLLAHPELQRLTPLEETETPSREDSLNESVSTAPELFIEKLGSDYIIYFTSDVIPSLRISPEYQQMLHNPEIKKEAHALIKDKIQSAIEFLRNIECRRQVIYSVTEAIVHRQHEFLDKGDKFINAVTLEDIAGDIEVSPMIISHVIKGKYVHTPQGVVELRCLLTEKHEQR